MQKTQETQVQSLVKEDLLEKEMATHSSILAWRIPWTEEPGGPQPMGSWRVVHKRWTQHTAPVKEIVNIFLTSKQINFTWNANFYSQNELLSNRVKLFYPKLIVSGDNILPLHKVGSFYYSIYYGFRNLELCPLVQNYVPHWTKKFFPTKACIRYLLWLWSCKYAYTLEFSAINGKSNFWNHVARNSEKIKMI